MAKYDTVWDKCANKDIFEKIDGIWMHKFKVAEDFEIKVNK